MVTLADIAGMSTTVPIVFPPTSSGGRQVARWLQFIVAGTGLVRLGDSSVTVSKGLPLASGAGQYITPCGEYLCYQSGEFWAYIPTGATLSVGFKEKLIP